MNPAVYEIFFLINTVLCAVHYYFYLKKDIWRTLSFFIGVIIIAGVAEYLAIKITGSYEYQGWNLYFLEGMPAGIAISWGGMAYFSMMIATRMTRQWEGKKVYFLLYALFAGYIGLSWDIILDPVSVSAGWWHWGKSTIYGVPWSNFAAQFIWNGMLCVAYRYINTRDWSFAKQQLAWVIALPLILVLSGLINFPLVTYF